MGKVLSGKLSCMGTGLVAYVSKVPVHMRLSLVMCIGRAPDKKE